MPRLRPHLFVASLLLILAAPLAAFAGDWPQWRYDAGRSAAAPDDLPPQLRLHWSRALPQLKPAWPDQPKMQFDLAYEPVVVGQRMFVGSSHDDSVTAYDTRTGEEVWRSYADGPIRFAPLVWKEKLYFASDDGYLYCLQAADGSLLWRFRGGPSDRKILGNERLISTWPARGAPVIADGKIYFAAGIWPFMGIFLHALDATTGDVLWTNDGDGSIYIKQPHNTDSFAGVAPQGALVAIGDKLLVPGGRSVPACYDRNTGAFVYYNLAENGKRGGGSAVAAVDELLFNGGAAFSLEGEKYLGSMGPLVTFADGRLHAYEDKEIHAFDLQSSKAKLQDTVDRKGVKTKTAKWTIEELGEAEAPELTTLIQAGKRLYAGSEGRVLAFDLPLPKKGKAKPAWEISLAGTPLSLIAADDRLFAVTLEGTIHCFGAAESAPAAAREHALSQNSPESDAAAVKQASEILRTTAARAGYCLVLGSGSLDLVPELVRQSELRIITIEPDAAAAHRLRERLRMAGIGGRQASVLTLDLDDGLLPPYLASLIVVNSLPAEESQSAWVEDVFASLRPFGGAAHLAVSSEEGAALVGRCDAAKLPNAVWKPAEGATLLIRAGAIPDSADWTHEHADAANTRVSKDKVVKAPLGMLWFGGSSNEGILPRHGHGPQPQVVEGRLFIEGSDMIRSLDIYTGRVLWETSLPGVGALYDNTSHQPGANAAGTNFISTPAGVYVAYGNACLQLDPATGKQLAQFQLPAAQGTEPPLWGYLNVFDDYLIGGADPLYDPALGKGPPVPKPSNVLESAKALIGKAFKADNDNFSSSNRLVIMDRQSGKVLWTADARSGFRHNAICIGGGRLYAIDRLSGAQVSRLKRRGESAPQPPRLVAFDLKTGKEIWSSEQDIFGTWLSYSSERDVLVEAGRSARDTLSDEPRGMRAYRAAGGKMLWENKQYAGPAMIHHDTILMSGSGCELLTGAPKLREHPLSGEPVEWTWTRNYGCNTPMASENLLTFRSGAAGYLDMCSDGGTGNFGGFRSSCTNNLVVAGGILTAPDYTRTCTCSYQNQTSLALVHMPEVETWTSFGSQTPKEAVRRVGINLGAPGDRKADDGTLWLEYPSVGGSSPKVAVSIEPENVTWFRRHSSQVSGPGMVWVAASGAEGLKSLKIKLSETKAPASSYTVRLHFMEPGELAAGQRVFDVRLQDETVLSELDVVTAAGGRNRALAKEFKGVRIGQELQVELIPAPGSKHPALLSGIEIQAE